VLNLKNWENHNGRIDLDHCRRQREGGGVRSLWPTNEGHEWTRGTGGSIGYHVRQKIKRDIGPMGTTSPKDPPRKEPLCAAGP